jgi:putative ABC transport system permease protein
MIFTSRTPLAWKNLTHDHRRLSVAVGGITFAVLLMFIQTGFRNALFDSTVKLVADLDTDLVLVSRGLYALPAQQRFNRQRIFQARTCEGVKEVHPLYVEQYAAVLKRPGHKGFPIRVLAGEPSASLFEDERVAAQSDSLADPRTALVDVLSKTKYGLPARDPTRLAQTDVELSGRKLHLVGNFSLGTDFANDGNLFMSDRNFAAYFPYRAAGEDPLTLVDLGVVRIERGADPQAVKRAIDAALPDDVAIFTKDELMRQERKFWGDSTPIGYIFTVGTVMGFVVGVIICYQIIYANIADHMAEFATLKAMGYSTGYFISVVLQESLYLSILGFVPGLLLSLALYWGLAQFTGLLMLLNLPRAALVYALTLAMCSVSGCLAMRKVLAADPAELF